MNRESIHVTFSEPLRRANVQPRLSALAEQTGMPLAQIAGQALKLGLGLLERDWRLLFPGADASSVTTPLDSVQPPALSAAAPASRATPTSPVRDLAEPPVPRAAATTHADPTGADARPEEPRAPITTPGDQTQHTAEPAAAAPSNPDPVTPPGVTTREAAQALGYRTEAAFRQHCQRHRDLQDRFSTKSGRERVWDLDGLRAEYLCRGFGPKGQALDEQAPDRLGAGEPATA